MRSFVRGACSCRKIPSEVGKQKVSRRKIRFLSKVGLKETRKGRAGKGEKEDWKQVTGVKKGENSFFPGVRAQQLAGVPVEDRGFQTVTVPNLRKKKEERACQEAR